MSTNVLYFAPSTCARVTLVALEKIACPFDIELVRFVKGEHRSEAYLSRNPKGKVPTLVFEGDVFTENVAILTFLNGRFPEAGLLPQARNDVEKAQQLADLCFCSSTLHPIVTRIRLPVFFAEGEAAVRSVYERAVEAMKPNFAIVESRLAEQDWWYPSGWSIMDAYLYWVWFRVTGAGFPGAEFPRFADHAERIAQIPAVAAMLEKDRQAEETLKSEGVNFVPPPLPAAN